MVLPVEPVLKPSPLNNVCFPKQEGAHELSVFFGVLP